MKTRHLLYGGLISVTLLGGCTGFLDKDPLVQPAAEFFFTNDTEANYAIIGIYSLSQGEVFELGPFMTVGDNCSDDTDLGNEVSDAYSWLGPTAQELTRFEIATNNSQATNLWNQGWTGIGRATLAIDKMEGNEMISAAKRDQFVGEAYFMRAYYYFFMTRQYGRLPIVDHTLTLEEYYIPRATIEQTWAFIESDLKKAADLLPEKSEYEAEDMGRATRGAALSLLGKAYIYQKKWQEAYDVFMDVVESSEYDLQPVYEDVFTLENENGMEVIYAIQHNTTGTGWANANDGSILSFYEHNAEPGSTVKWQNGWSMHCPTQDLVDAYEAGDPRLAATVIFPGEMFDGHVNLNSSSSTGYQPKKWYIPWDLRSKEDESDNPKNIIFIRYADVLLYLAEAANELGKTGEALDFLEDVRGRARASADDANVLPERTETDKDALRDLIWHERRVELACEGQRFFDIVRQGRAGEVMKAYYDKGYETIHSDGTRTRSQKGQHYQVGRNELMPIPEAAVTVSNGTMEQNPGY